MRARIAKDPLLGLLYLRIACWLGKPGLDEIYRELKERLSPHSELAAPICEDIEFALAQEGPLAVPYLVSCSYCGKREEAPEFGACPCACTHYCCRKHQKKHWKVHRKLCSAKLKILD